MSHQLSLRVVGFIASLILTLSAYFIILHPDMFSANLNIAIAVIFTLALIQSLVQLIFFIDVWQGKDVLWNIGIFASTVSIIFIVVYFSIWIINNLNYNM